MNNTEKLKNQFFAPFYWAETTVFDSRDNVVCSINSRKIPRTVAIEIAEFIALQLRR